MLKTTGGGGGGCPETALPLGRLAASGLGTRALTRPSPAPKQPQQLPCNRSTSNREHTFNDLIYQELAGRGTGAGRAAAPIHRS